MEQMAEINGVDVITSGLCILGLELGTKALIFCDCEGYENSSIWISPTNLSPTTFSWKPMISSAITEKILHPSPQRTIAKVERNIAKAYTYSTSQQMRGWKSSRKTHRHALEKRELKEGSLHSASQFIHQRVPVQSEAHPEQIRDNSHPLSSVERPTT